MGVTSRLALPYPELADRAIVPDDVRDLALAVDRAAIIDQGSLANRPVSSAASPGVRGRFYWATDESVLYHDDGTGWSAINPQLVTDGPAGTGSLRTLGTSGASAAAGNDARLSNQRVPTDASVTAAKVASTLLPSQGAGGAVEALRAIGTAVGQVAPGNDTRFPAGADIVDADIAAAAAIAESKLTLASDAAAATPSRRSLGIGAAQALPGNHISVTNERDPTDASVDWVKTGVGVGGIARGAFMAYRSSDSSWNANVAIVWNVVDYSVGGHYNAATGYYYAPYSGYYEFWASIWHTSAATARAQIFIGGDPVGYGAGPSSTGFYIHATRYMIAGRAAYVTMIDGANVSSGRHLSKFAGKLLGRG